MKNLVFSFIVLFVASVSSVNVYAQDGWITGKKVGEGVMQYVQGQKFKACHYQAGLNFSFSITISDYLCPLTVQYNPATQQWRAN